MAHSSFSSLLCNCQLLKASSQPDAEPRGWEVDVSVLVAVGLSKADGDQHPIGLTGVDLS